MRRYSNALNSKKISADMRSTFLKAIQGLINKNISARRRVLIPLNVESMRDDEFLYYTGAMTSTNMQRVHEEIQSNISSICNWELLGHNNLCDILNFSILRSNIKNEEKFSRLLTYFTNLKSRRVKINVGFGMILTAPDNGARYWRASANHLPLYESPITINNVSQLKTWFSDFSDSHKSALEMSASSFHKSDSSTKVIGMTNFTLFIYKTAEQNPKPKHGNAKKVNLPKALNKNRNLILFLYKRDISITSRAIIKDHICTFRCISAAKYIQKRGSNGPKTLKVDDYKAIEMRARKYAKSWQKYKGISSKSFDGVDDDQYDELSSYFSVNINLFSYDEENKEYERYFESSNFDKNLLSVNILVYQNHCIYIKNVDQITTIYQCHNCCRIFSMQKNWQRHVSKNVCKKLLSGELTKKEYKAGIFMPITTCHDVFKEYELFAPEDARYNNTIAVYDW